ncbi:hypothetical protein AB0N77_09750 [Streptomyces misionensis]|uniref:hypothetical protein n=1 Tax=Streptomyces misionensis TaxID=67331 RepID=UPI00342F58DE
MSEEPATVDTLYLDAEHFVLTAEAQPPLEPREHVRPVGLPFPGLLPNTAPVQGGDWLADYLEWKAEHGQWGDEPSA